MTDMEEPLGVPAPTVGMKVAQGTPTSTADPAGRLGAEAEQGERIELDLHLLSELAPFMSRETVDRIFEMACVGEADPDCLVELTGRSRRPAPFCVHPCYRHGQCANRIDYSGHSDYGKKWAEGKSMATRRPSGGAHLGIRIYAAMKRAEIARGRGLWSTGFTRESSSQSLELGVIRSAEPTVTKM